MPLPKRQHSKQRGRKRRTHWKIHLKSFSGCPQCKKEILPHRVCPFCGFYKGRPVVAIKTKTKNKEEKE
ncbi:MAG: 50S ribosomal protein L32 [Omnitrophica WOR_2 bacterium GWA2_47_8]|nr:MAG: 50S ribosomal protein L32 [Omnitrophica WOR_2 bacterium GWA2_47_8]